VKRSPPKAGAAQPVEAVSLLDPAPEGQRQPPQQLRLEISHARIRALPHSARDSAAPPGQDRKI